MKVGRGDRDRVPLKLRMLEKINWSERDGTGYLSLCPTQYSRFIYHQKFLGWEECLKVWLVRLMS